MSPRTQAGAMALCLAAMLLLPAAQAQPGAAPQASGAPVTAVAEQAAMDWLRLVDYKDYGASWDQAGALFRGAVGRDQWQQAAAAARGPLGALASRSLLSVRAVDQLPGAPAGQYMLIQYRSSYASLPEAQETLTLRFEPDGRWRVLGYHVR